MITGIEHTGLVARDVDKICEFYEKFFDCKVVLAYDNGTKFLKCHNCIIEVYPMKSDDENVYDNYVKGLRHLAFETDDFDVDRQKLLDSGVKPAAEPIIKDTFKLALFYDVEMNLFHLIQRPKSLLSE